MKNANPLFRAGVIRWLRPSARAGCALAVSLAVAACAKEKAASLLTKAASTTVKTVGDWFPIRVGDKIVRMQLAVRSSEMQRGLMERRNLGADEGMIFVYDRPQQMTFWMRNTPTPLDIGFFSADGVLQEVYPLHPFDETTVASHSRELQFALEVNQGWFRSNGVKPGAKLDLKALTAALKDRGFDPAKFSLGETPK